MNIFYRLFGKWEKESEQLVLAKYSSIFKCLNGEREMILVIEKHPKTGKKRAYIKDIFGDKTEIDMSYVESLK